jgi:hypothetical protein
MEREVTVRFSIGITGEICTVRVKIGTTLRNLISVIQQEFPTKELATIYNLRYQMNLDTVIGPEFDLDRVYFVKGPPRRNAFMESGTKGMFVMTEQEMREEAKFLVKDVDRLIEKISAEKGPTLAEMIASGRGRAASDWG